LGLSSRVQSSSEPCIQSTARKRPYINKPEATYLARYKDLLIFLNITINPTLSSCPFSSLASLLGTARDTATALRVLPFCAPHPHCSKRKLSSMGLLVYRRSLRAVGEKDMIITEKADR